MSSLELDRQSAVFDRADPALVSHYVNEHVGPHQIFVRHRCRPDAELRHRKLSTLGLCQIRYGNRVRVTSPALETIYHLQVVLRGHCHWTHAGQTEILTPGDLLLINPDEDVDLVYSHDCGKFVLTLPRPMLHQAAADQHLVMTGQELHFSTPRHRLGAVPGLPELLHLIMQESCSPATSEAVKKHYAGAVCAKLLDHFPTNTTPSGAPDSADALDRVIAFIDENLDRPLSVNMLARQVHVSSRSLYSLFQHRLGVSPMQFIRQRRLACVHRELTGSGRPPDSITAVALAHGFSHLGRFSSQYERQYGELPSETLRRRH